MLFLRFEEWSLTRFSFFFFEKKTTTIESGRFVLSFFALLYLFFFVVVFFKLLKRCQPSFEDQQDFHGWLNRRNRGLIANHDVLNAVVAGGGVVVGVEVDC